MQKRVQYVDLASGILILWVMSFHAMNGCKVFGDVDVRVALPFLTFSMPWFFYKSGQFARSGIPISEVARKGFKKFIIPFLKWGLIGYGVYLVIQAVNGTWSVDTCINNVWNTFYIYGYIPINTPSWFILSLFAVRVISQSLIKWSVPPALIMVVGIALGYLFHLWNNPQVPFYLANISMGIAFYMMGYRFSRWESHKWLFVACAVGYVSFLVFGCSIVGHHRNILLEGHYLLWPLFAYCGIITFNNVCRYLDGLISRSRFSHFRPLSFIGRNAMTLLVSHALIYAPIIQFSTLSPWQTVGLIWGGYVLFLTPLLWRKKGQASS